VLISRPAQAERSLSFAALGDLVGEVVPELAEELPKPRRRALEVALLIADPGDEAPDARAVSVAVLTLLQRLVSDGPLLLAIDDYQWIDTPTRSALAFALRRLDDAPVGLLLSKRTASDAGDPPLSRTRHVVLAPLSFGAIGRIVHLRTGRPLARPVLRRVHELAGGNPFLALELARAVQREELAFDRTATLPPALKRLVAGRIAALPEETQHLLAALAATSERTMGLVETLSASSGSDGLEPAIDADIVDVRGGKIAFTHPLLASAAYARLSQPRQRELHRRLATLVSGVEERARHLGLVTEQPNAEVAQTLEAAAAETRRRGASASAAELAEEALRLTPPGDPGRRHRMLVAAGDLLEAGDSERAQVLLEGAVEVSAPGDERADALTRLAWIRAQRDSVLAAADLQRAALAEAHDPAVRTSIERGLAWATHVAGNLVQAGEHAQRAVELARMTRDQSALPLALADDMFIRFLRGHGFDRDAMNRALDLERSAGPLPIIGKPSWLSGMVLTYVGELDEARGVLSALRDDAVARGDERAVPYVLNWLARVECYAGNWVDAAEYAEETYQSALETGQDVERTFAASTRALLAARMGAAETARSAAAEALELAERIQLVPAALEAKAAIASLELSLARPAAAYDQVQELHAHATAAGFHEPSVFRFHGDAIEAAVAVGKVDEAEDLIAYVVSRQEVSPWTATIAARGHALVAGARGDMDLARNELARALELHALFSDPFEHGRTLLALGTVERRAQAKRAARGALEDAAVVFDRLGADLWLERARAELGRIGGRRSQGSHLTPSERLVVELVVEGRTNREVASALFVSERTVEGHLSRIYGKLGVRSRTELVRHVPPAE
jgi:DNA-binding CsgD family transcriptional regulator